MRCDDREYREAKDKTVEMGLLNEISKPQKHLYSMFV